MPGAGKSRLASVLAKSLKLPKIDIDSEIERIEKLDIRSIVNTKGESHFRKMEREVLLQTSRINHAIISCGGGTACFFDNMDWINKHGKSIWLDVPTDILAKRIFKNQSRRPMFSGLSYDDLKEKLNNLLLERKIFFTKAKIIFKASTEKGVRLSSVIQSLTKSN
jgi:shikimate kinase